MRRLCFTLLIVGLLLTGGFRAQAGVVLRVFYDEIVGDTVEDLVNASHFPNGPNPSIGALFVELLTEGLDTGPDTDSGVNDFGTHTRGFIEIPMDGDYQFFVASDDPSELWMADPSTPSDNTSTNLVAFETGCCTELFSGDRLADRSSDPMTLSKGDKIYFEVRHKEITGDEFIRVGWLKPDGVREVVPGYHLAPFPLNGDTNNLQPLADVAPEIIDSYFGEFLPTPGQPQSLTVTEVDPARFTVTYLASQPVTIQWQLDGEDIPGANLSTYFIPETSLDDNGGQYTVTISNEFGETTSVAANLTVNADTTAPTLVSARGSGNPHGIIVAFSEAVTEATATDTSNYEFSGQDLTISAAEMLDTQTILLSVSEFTNDPLTLTVNNIEDRSSSNNVIAANSSVEVEFGSQGVSVLIFEDLLPRMSGSGPDQGARRIFTEDVFPNDPSQVLPIDGLDVPQTAADFGGANLEDFAGYVFGRITAPETGTYEFFIRSDDPGIFRLSSDASQANLPSLDNPTLEQTGCCNALGDRGGSGLNATVELQGGQSYFFDAVYAEYGGGDYLQIGWIRPGGSDADLEVVPADVLSSELETGTLSFSQQPQSQSVVELRSVTFNAEATGSDSLAISYQWYRDGEAIPGENKNTLTLDPATASDDGAEFTVTAFNNNGTFNTVTSDPATLTVETDDQAPGVVRTSGTPLLDSIFIVFDEPITAESAENLDNYTVTPASGGSELTIDSATLLADGQSVRLDTAEQEPGTRYDVAMQNIADVTPAANAFNGTEQFISFRRQTGGLTALFYEYDSGGLDGFYPSPRGIGQYPENFNPFGADIRNSMQNIQNRNSGVIDYFESPNTGDIDTLPGSDVANQYGQVVFGWIRPTETADYTFYLATDDNSELWLSTDEDPSNAQLIANEPQWVGVRDYAATGDDGNLTHHSAPVTLQAGEDYYVEVIMQEGGGGDNLAVAWTTDGSVPANDSNPIPGDVLVSNLPVFADPVLVSRSPIPGTVAVSNSGSVQVVLKDGEIATVDQGSIVLTLNGETVTPTVTQDGDETTVEYVFDPPLDSFTDVNVELTYADSEGGGDTLSWSFQTALVPDETFVAGTRFIEAEDWNHGGGQWIEGANGGPTGQPYTGGDYQGLEGTPDVDYFDTGGGGGGDPLYRYVDGTDPAAQPGPATVDFGFVDRGAFDVESNWKVGWTAGGEWMNYTRDFPEEETTYEVYANISSGGADPNPTLQRVTGDPTQSGQSVEQLGEFSGPASGDWGTAIFYKMHAAGDPSTPAPVTLSGVNTIRLTIGGAMDVNYLAFVPSEVGPPAPDIGVSYADGTITLEWTGTLEAADAVTGPYEEVSGATSPMQVTPDEAGKFWRSRN